MSDFCTFCLVNSTGSGTTTTGWLRSVEIAFPECNPNSDTSVIGIMGVDSSGAAPFGGKKLNASWIQLSRLYIHYQTNIGAGAVGCHGIFHRRPGYAKH